MQIKSFRIQNFKGIKDCTVSFDNSSSRVFSLIGLNESGKTTILEAINHFVASDTAVSSLYNSNVVEIPVTSLVPKGRKFNFNGQISIKATVELNEYDIGKFEQAFDEHGYELDRDRILKILNVIQYYNFSDSNLKNHGRNWDVAFSVKKKRGKNFKRLDVDHELWATYHQTFRELLPRVVYFPTFLFDLPQKIYIEPYEGEPASNAYYRRLIQDVLDSINEGLDVKRHIVDRIRHQKSSWSWMGFLATDYREQVNHVILKASNKITGVIMDSWKRVFGKDLGNKRIDIEYFHEEERDLIYMKIYMIDGHQKYEIAERSLGFRWFFCFWMFTYFRTLRQGAGGVIFLLDEPASNLHATAQEELLANLGSLVGQNNVVVYSTHSHYLINPKWLDSAYIIANAAVNVDGIENEFEVSGDTDITATRYRQFVSAHPNQRTYFLPVLDALEYRPSQLDLNRPSLLVEGKADYAFFEAARIGQTRRFAIVPANGAKSMDPLIGILTGWGVPFVILLDDDKEGRDARQMYKAAWAVPEDRMKCIADFDPDFTGKSFETVFMDNMTEALRTYATDGTVSKQIAQSYLYEALASDSLYPLAPKLKAFADEVRKWSEKALGV